MKPTTEQNHALFKTLSKLKAQYDGSSDNSKAKELNLEKLKTETKTDDEIEKLVKSSLEQKYSALKDSEKIETDEKKNQLSAQIEQLNKQAESERNARENDYATAQENLENQALKRGVQRSSIIIGELGELENTKQNEIATKNQELKTQIGKIDAEIEKLSVELNSSLKKMDMAKAVEIDEQIDKLKTERDKNYADAIKYNNQIVEKETDFNNSFKEKYPNAVKSEKEETLDKMANEVLKFYMQYDDPKEALEAFDLESDLAEYLGKNYNIIRGLLEARF